jgi:hypothetical protein
MINDAQQWFGHAVKGGIIEFPEETKLTQICDFPGK